MRWIFLNAFKSGLENKLKSELEGTPLSQKIQDTIEEIDLRKKWVLRFHRLIYPDKHLALRNIASRSVYEGILKESKKSNTCAACTRPLNTQELRVFEKHVSKYLRLQIILLAYVSNRYIRSLTKSRMQITMN